MLKFACIRLDCIRSIESKKNTILKPIYITKVRHFLWIICIKSLTATAENSTNKKNQQQKPSKL